MRLKRLLIHRCTFIIQNAAIGEDEYGRDVFGESKVPDVPCRLDKITKKILRSDGGIDLVEQNILFIDASQQVAPMTKITDMKDKDGNTILPGVFGIEEVIPQYSRIRLHHYEVELKKERD